MNIRTANENDKKQLYRLWTEAFSDGEDVIDMFFGSVITADNTVLAEADGRIISALYLIEAEIVCRKKPYKAYYVYAAATDKKFRRQGIMKKLLDYSTLIARQRNIDYLFLHPASEKLYGYYSKNGFVTAFYDNNCDNGDCFVKWGSEVIRLERLLSEGEIPEEKTNDDCPRKTGMIKRLRDTAPVIENAYLGITLE